MNTEKHTPAETISENFLDMRKILASKGIKANSLVIALLNRLLHVKELNAGIYKHREKYGIDFASAVIHEELKVKMEVVNAHNIPAEGSPIIAGNHPLGGPDGLALLSAVGQHRKDVLFPVNDFLMFLPGLKSVFVPIDKVHKNATKVDGLEKAFGEQNTLLYFPAGICSRKQGREIKDLEWKPTFVKKAVKYQRDIVPIYFDARNRKRFYLIANLRKKLGIKFNFEMALLPGEMFAQKGKKMRLIIGKAIPYSTFDERHTAREWAALLREHSLQLKHNPEAQFNY